MAPTRASIFTSPLLTLGRPNLPATKNGTEVPLIGTGSVRLLENVPVGPPRKTTAPPLAADTPVIPTLTLAWWRQPGWLRESGTGRAPSRRIGLRDSRCC